MTAESKIQTQRRVRHALPAVMMRAGTSKGLFFHRSDLPASEKDWAAPLLGAMGSKFNDVRQIDGVGGASSVTSKVAVIAPSAQPGADVDYTFVQVAVGKETIDLSGNCGNMCSGVGPFAIQEGLVVPPPGARTVDVRIYNTNTKRYIVETIALDENGEVLEDGDHFIPGVKAPGSEIKVAFVDPAGSMTGKLFPTGRRLEQIVVDPIDVNLEPFVVDVTLIDAANPFVFVDAQTLPMFARQEDPDSPICVQVAEAIRQRAAVQMGLAPDLETASKTRATPKIAYVSPPEPKAAGKGDVTGVKVLAYSMGKTHPTLPLTGGVCLASATVLEGTVAHRASLGGKPVPESFINTPERTPSPPSEKQVSAASGDVSPEQTVHITHGGGTMEVKVQMAGGEIKQCSISRTARTLFKGSVMYYN
ncbi:PrpF protein-domain-containing protein [Stachybotrys elegans]|uniref:PrpF protein-domain-containing protein n=1 Tax=Stachybotrys elegans TaxID=80388 RepID=A0A8K0SH03_9HYPO|nr:PrpF protein-domain-containing protein [Stachybotrys elegans]